jgi:hypothetical protein
MNQNRDNLKRKKKPDEEFINSTNNKKKNCKKSILVETYKNET